MTPRFVQTAIAAAMLLSALPASAQQLGLEEPARRLSLDLVAGAGAVEKVGALAGLTLAVRLTDRLEVVGDGLWSSNAVTRRRLDVATNLGAHIQATQVSPASATVKAPVFYGGGGVRIPLVKRPGWHPYILVSAGMARVVLEPTVTLAGGDITAKLPQFGITLGSDLTGELTKPAASAAVGLRTSRGRYYIDFGVRYVKVQTPGQPTSIIGAVGAFGFGL